MKTSYANLSCPPAARTARSRGFTLVEVAISLVLLGLAATGIFAVLNQQVEQRRIADTNAALASARDALLSFLTTYGRLPCPAQSTTNGLEAVASSGSGVYVCTAEAGFLPAKTLGMSNLDAWGLLEGGWHDAAGATNGTYLRAIRYAVTGLGGNTAAALTSVSLGAPTVATRRKAVQSAFDPTSAANPVNPQGYQGLFVCASITGIKATPYANRCGVTASNLITANAAVVIWSLGGNAADLTSYSFDENQNKNLTVPRVLISRPYAPPGASATQFDDQVAWISYSTIADRLVSAGYVQ